MSNYISSYHFTTDSGFGEIASLPSLTDLYVVGGAQGRGTFTRLNMAGAVQWSHQYTMPGGNNIGFGQVVACDNGDFLLYGGQSFSANANDHLVVRVDGAGNVLWAKTYHRATTRFNIRIVKSTFDTYYICGWHNVSPSIDDMEVIRINGSGTILANVNLDFSDDQLFDMVAYGDGVAIIGSTPVNGSWDTVLAGFDKNLNVLWSKSLRDPNFQQGRALTYLGNDNFTLSAENDGAGVTSIIAFNPNASTAVVATYDIDASGDDSNFRRIVWDGTFFYHLTHSSGVNSTIVTKFNSSFSVVWRKRVLAGSGEYYRGLLWNASQPNSLFLTGGVLDSTGWNSLLVSTDLDLNSCVTVDLGVPARTSSTFPISPWTPTLTRPSITVQAITLTRTSNVPPRAVICAGTGITTEGTLQYQSPYVYLQAAGSDGADDSVPGIDLRWNFLRELGSKHIAKGNLAAAGSAFATSIAFNRANDFVKLYRSPWSVQYQVNFDLASAPSSKVESGPQRLWRYTGLVAHDPALTVDVEVRFMDVAQYDLLKATWGSGGNPYDIVSRYTGVIEMGTVSKLAVYYRIGFGNGDPASPVGNGSFRYEVVALPDALDVSTRQIYCREVASGLVPGGVHALKCENIEYLRFDYRDGIAPLRIEIITYDNYISGTESIGPGWTALGDFSLSIDNGVVADRLHKSPDLIVDNTWRKFNEPAGGEFRVKTANYLDRWNQPVEGLREAVVSYLSLSVTDPLAIDLIPNSDPLPNNSEMEVSYLDMLQLVGLDYHVARMLGLGHIDTTTGAHAPDEFVYLMGYVTSASLDGGPATLQTHLYMTPPLTFTDYKLPPAPQLEPVQYGLYLDNNTGNPTLLTDPQGYSPYAPIRFINLNREKFRHELPMEPFFYTPQLFCMCSETIPVAFGVEYGAGGIGSGGWVRPELSNDSAYQDPGGLNEVVPVLDTGENPAFIHQETQNGVHHYAMYTINWFSRVSDLGNEVETDYTLFPPNNTLLPPFNFQAQLIQPESPRIFTTAPEQARLAAIAGADKTLVRVTFDWDENHNRAYQYADKVEFLWRNEPPAIIRGAIQTGPGSIVEDPVNHTITVKTTSFTITSTTPVQVVQPNLPVAAPYVGGRFVVGGEAYHIEQVLTTGLNPILVLKQIRSTYSQDIDLDGVFETSETWGSPAEGDRFIITENLDQASSWDITLTKKVNLASFLPVHTETVTHEDGLVETVHIGGLVDVATINHVYDPDPAAAPNTPTGVYELTFATQNLAATGDPDVDYYGGKLRCYNWAGTVIKALKVWSIDNSGSTLKVVVYDPDFGSDPIIPNTPAAQSGRWVNFHPSYRAYLYVQSPFNAANIMAAAGEGTRETFMAARSLDTGAGLHSYMTPPAVLLAREIITPVPPGIPQGPLFATRPNFYGKATYTFDVEVQNPFALIFYRANERRILDTLYKPETVADIYAQLDAVSDVDQYLNIQRWIDLVYVNTDADDLFIELQFNGFRFPIPNNPDYIIPLADPSVIIYPFAAGTVPPGSASVVAGSGMTMREVVTQAIEGAFLPMTEQPLVFQQLESSTMQTSGRPPKVRNANGERLVYLEDADYDPWPMAVRFEKNTAGTYLTDLDAGYGNPANKKYVRLTDYTLDGASKNIYFYFGVEMTNTLEISAASPIKGPVQLINAAPPEAPSIRQVITTVDDPFAGTQPGVELIVTPYLPSENIVHYQLYRALDADDALNIRTMTSVKKVEAGSPILDDFSDLGYVPYTDLLFYSVVAYRRVLNEQGEYEYIPSLPSQLAITNVVDNVNPDQPLLTWTSDPLTSIHPYRYNNVQLTWETKVYKGTYNLYKMDAQGIWNLIYATQNPTAELTVPLSATSLGSSTLVKEDGDGDTIFHVFKIQVENSSGLVSKGTKTLTI
jgi:hypothetical protein